MRQRFQVRTLTGFQGSRFARKPVTTFYVMDSVFCWQIVHTTQNENEALLKAGMLNNAPRLRMAESWYVS